MIDQDAYRRIAAWVKDLRRDASGENGRMDSTEMYRLADWLESLAQPSASVSVAQAKEALNDAAGTFWSDDINEKTDPEVYVKAERAYDAAVESLIVAVRAEAVPAQPNEWRPIESAPKDGTRVDVYVPGDGRRTNATFSTALDTWTFKYGPEYHQYEKLAPTHWMPLPLPPSGQETK